MCVCVCIGVTDFVCTYWIVCVFVHACVRMFFCVQMLSSKVCVHILMHACIHAY